MHCNEINEANLVCLRELIEANYAGRDTLYAAAEALDDEARSTICKHLADRLAGRAIELQQRVQVAQPGTFDAEDLECFEYDTHEAFLHMIVELRGIREVIVSLEQCEHNLKEKYDQALLLHHDSDTQSVLERQRDEVEFAEHVLHAIQNRPNQ